MVRKIKNSITLDDLSGMIKRGFDGNTKEHQKMFKILDRHAVTLVNHTGILVDHTERLKRIEAKLEGIVYRREFEELDSRLKKVEAKLGIK